MLDNQFIDIVDFKNNVRNYLRRNAHYIGTSAPLCTLTVSKAFSSNGDKFSYSFILDLLRRAKHGLLANHDWHMASETNKIINAILRANDRI